MVDHGAVAMIVDANVITSPTVVVMTTVLTAVPTNVIVTAPVDIVTQESMIANRPGVRNAKNRKFKFPIMNFL